MLPASDFGKRRLRLGSATLLICISLPIADRLGAAVGPETAAVCVFVLLFVAWFAVGLLMDGWSGKDVAETDPGNDPDGYLS